MPWNLPRPKFGLRTLLLAILLCAIGLAVYTSPGRWRAFRNQQARQRIDPYELNIAGDGNPKNVPPELVAILGDSRLKHWWSLRSIHQLVGDRVATAGNDGTVRIWAVNTGRQEQFFGAASMTASADGKLVYIGALDGEIACWDVASATEIGKFGGGGWSGESLHLATNADGTVVVAEKRRPDWSREITIWNAKTGRLLHQFAPATTGGGAMCVTRDGKFFTWEQDASIQVSETATGKVVRTIGPIMSGSYKSALGQVVLTPDELTLFVGSAQNKVVSFDWATGAELERIGDQWAGTHCIAMDPTGRGIVIGEGPSIFFKQEKGWSPFGSRGRGGPGGVVDWFGNRIALGQRDGQITFWRGRVEPYRVIGGPAKAIRRLAFHPQTGELFTGDNTGMVAVYSAGAWQPMRNWLAHGGEIEEMVMAASGSRLGTASRDGIAVWDPQTANEVGTVRTASFHPQYFSLSPDGELVVMQESFSAKKIDLHNLETGRVGRIGPLPTVLYGTPDWSPNGERLACWDAGSSLEVFDLISGKLLGSFGKSNLGSITVNAVWFADNNRLVTAGWGRDEVHVFEVGSAKPVQTINAGSGSVKDVALHPSEQWIALCGYKCPVQLWHLPTSKLVKSWQLGPQLGIVHQVAFSPDGHYLATVNGNGTVYILNLDGVLKP